MMSRAGLILVGLMVLVLALFPAACVAKECTPSSCGNIPNISYPFGLKGDPPGCYHRLHQLACENNRTTLYQCGGKYYVQQILYDYGSIRVVDASLDDKDSCSILHYSLTRKNFSCKHHKPWSNPYRLDNTGKVVLMKCTQPAKSSVYVDATPVTDKSSSPEKNLYALYGFRVQTSDVPEHCSIQAVAPAPFPSSFNITGGQLSILEIHRELLKGFDLAYNPYYKYPKLSFKQRFRNILNDLRFFFEVLRYYLFSIRGIREMYAAQIYRVKSSQNSFSVLFIYDPVAGASTIIHVIFIVRTSLGILCFIALFTYKLRQRHLSSDDTIEEFFQSHNNFMPIRYSYSQIKKMTKGFKDKLGQGGFGSVYKGKTRSGHLIAVKVLGKSKTNGKDFINEIATIGRIHHVNVVRLIGFCVEGSKQALIYDFMANGSLDKFIFPKGENINLLSWEQTYKIGLGVARGIEYLHRGCDMQILHFDIKPHNILLDENFIPKVSDFGLAKLYPVDDSIVSLTAVRGTRGYIAPELFYKNIGGISYKADVYSFGMLLMEMVGKRKNVNPSVEQLSQIYFPSWIYDQISQGGNIELGDANEGEKEIARKMIIVALWCTQIKPVDRPSMSKVLEMLEGEVELLQIPPKPLLNPQEMLIVDHADNNPTRAAISSYNDIGTITLDVR